MTSPLPPSTPHRLAQARPVMFAEAWTDPNGETRTAEHDGVLLELFQGPDVVSTLFTTPETAIALALHLQRAAVTAINTAVTDTGTRTTAAERLARVNAAYKAADA